MKKVQLTAKPKGNASASADAWVRDRSPETEELKRLTFDVTKDLHQRIKITCALKGEAMADALRDLLERHYPAPGEMRGGADQS